MTPSKFAALVIARFTAIAALVATKGFHVVSDWWRDTVDGFLRSFKRQLCIRAGRRSGKSSTLCLLAIAWALVYPAAAIPLGDLGVIAFVSVDRREVDGRLRTIETLLKALGIKHERRGDYIDLIGRPIRFQAFTASVAGVSGFTCILAICDECSKWKDTDTGANPAREVLASLRPTMATQPLARIILSSSPWSTLDAHAEAFARGDDDFQMTAFAPTWIANPSLTEADTHELEPDIGTHSREYAAIPMADAATAWFSADAIDAAIDTTRPLILARPKGGWNARIFIGAGCDFAFSGDSSAIAVVHQVEGRYELAEIDELCPRPGAPLKPSHVCARFADVLHRHGARRVYADAWQRESVSEFLAVAQISVGAAPAGQTGKIEVYTKARTLLHQGLVRLPKHDKLRGQLREVTARPTSTGMTITSPRRKSGHGDLVSALTLALWDAGSPSSAYAIKLARLSGKLSSTRPEETEREREDRKQIEFTLRATRSPQDGKRAVEEYRRRLGLEPDDEP